MNPSDWPYDPDSAVVSEDDISWANAAPGSIESMTVTHIRAMTRESVRLLMGRKALVERMNPDVVAVAKSVLDGKPVKGVAEFKLATVTSVAERVMSLEHVRAGIPVENLLGALMTAAYTGEMDGVAVSPKERIDILKFLTNKVMPDVKTVDGDAKSEKADMKVKKLRDFTKEEIKKLSEDELRKLLMEAADG